MPLFAASSLPWHFVRKEIISYQIRPYQIRSNLSRFDVIWHGLIWSDLTWFIWPALSWADMIPGQIGFNRVRFSWADLIPGQIGFNRVRFEIRVDSDIRIKSSQIRSDQIRLGSDGPINSELWGEIDPSVLSHVWGATTKVSPRDCVAKTSPWTLRGNFSTFCSAAARFVCWPFFSGLHLAFA